MLRSMTAYGRGCVDSEIGRLIVEIQSVNRKFLDIAIFLPREFIPWEAELKKWLKPYTARGQVTIRVSASFADKASVNLIPQLALFREVRLIAKKVAQECAVDEEALFFVLIDKTEGLLTFEENREQQAHYQKALKEAFDLAAVSFVYMKEREGLLLLKELEEHFTKMRQNITKIAEIVSSLPARLREKMMQRIREFLDAGAENEERIAREVAVYAEKMDVTEEIIRFSAHLDYAAELLQGEDAIVGKNLEFILQELGREINTLMSKASDVEVTRAGIEIKSRLEKVREQIQNVE